MSSLVTGTSCFGMEPLRLPQWHDDLLADLTGQRCRQGFSLLFYGYGSKTGLLSELVKEQLTDGGVLEVNGLAPALSARQVLIRASAMLRKTSVYQDRCSPLMQWPLPPVHSLLLQPLYGNFILATHATDSSD